MRTFRPATQDMIERRLTELGADDRRRVRRERDAQVRARLSGHDQSSARGGVRRDGRRRASSAATTSCATSTRRWARRISRSCCRRSPARSRGSGRAALEGGCFLHNSTLRFQRCGHSARRRVSRRRSPERRCRSRSSCLGATRRNSRPSMTRHSPFRAELRRGARNSRGRRARAVSRSTR